MKTAKKRIVLILCFILTAAVIIVSAWGLYAYWHPRQDILTFRAGNVSYPGIMFNSYEGCGLFKIPPMQWEQMEDFNEQVQTFVHELRLEYGKSLELDYNLEYDKNGTDVIFSGQGTKAAGTINAISRRMHFDIVIRKDAHWN